VSTSTEDYDHFFRAEGVGAARQFLKLHRAVFKPQQNSNTKMWVWLRLQISILRVEEGSSVLGIRMSVPPLDSVWHGRGLPLERGFRIGAGLARCI